MVVLSILYHTVWLQKKPVVQLKAASAINRIMVLCDATLSLLNMLNLEVCDSNTEARVVTSPVHLTRHSLHFVIVYLVPYLF